MCPNPADLADIRPKSAPGDEFGRLEVPKIGQRGHG